MQENFLIARAMKNFLISIDRMIINLPRSERIMKDRFINDSLDTLEMIYIANNLDIEKRIGLQVKILGKISMLDYYLERSYINHYISEKVCFQKADELLKINKMIVRWMHGSKSK